MPSVCSRENVPGWSVSAGRVVPTTYDRSPGTLRNHNESSATARRLFSEIWNLHHRAVFRGCLAWMAGRRDDADEAYGRVAMRALERCPPSFRDAEHARAWLLTLTRNVCMDIHRERRREREVSIDEEPHTEPTVTGDPESSYLLGERDRQLRTLVRRLPTHLRRTVELHVFREMKYDEVARELGISVVNVRKRMQEVRRRMRDGIELGVSEQTCEPETEPPPEARPASILVTPSIAGGNHDERDSELVLPADVGPAASRIRTLERYCAKHPRGWRGRLELARAFAAVGNVADALPHYRYVAQRQPFPLDHWLELGAALEALGSRGEALAAYDAGALQAGRETARQHLGALAAARRGNVDAARELLALASDHDPEDGRHARAYGAICLKAGRPVEAAQALEQALVRDPADPLAPSLLHDALVDTGRPLAARAVVESAVARHPSNVPAIERFLADSSRVGELESLLAASLLQLAPDRARSQAVIARIALARGEKSAAEARLLVYQHRHPCHAGAWLALADFYRQSGCIGKALDAALKARTLDPDGRDAWRMLCRIVPLAGDPEGAQRLVCDLTRRFKDDAMLLGAAGAMALAAENRPLALELCARAVDLQPEIASLRRSFAAVLADAGEYDAALRELEQGSHAVPADDGHEDGARIALLLANVYRRIGSTTASHTWARIAVARAEACRAIDVALSSVLQAAASELLGDEATARRQYRVALESQLLYPERGRAEMALRRLDGVAP
jgi:RNA polymerase sigma factor (sigma-70 family)